MFEWRKARPDIFLSTFNGQIRIWSLQFVFFLFSPLRQRLIFLVWNCVNIFFFSLCWSLAIAMSGVDRIGTLPDAVLCHILSFMQTKIVVATSVLSKRGRPLWRSVPTVDLDDATHPNLPPQICTLFFSWPSGYKIMGWSRNTIRSRNGWALTAVYHRVTIGHSHLHKPCGSEVERIGSGWYLECLFTRAQNFTSGLGLFL